MTKKNAPTYNSQSTNTQRHYISITDTLNAFRDAMARSMGTAPDDFIPDQIIRWDDPQGKRGNKACYCQLFSDGRPAGYFGNWRNGHYETWVYGGYSSLTPLERTHFKQQITEAKVKREAEEEAKRHSAAERARGIWEKAYPAPENHPYLIKKMIGAGLARIYNGALVLPLGGFDDRLHSLQFIGPDSSKRFLSYGRKKECFIPVQMPKYASRTLVCEGWATGQSLAEDYPSARILAALDAGNLEPVALASRRFWPDTELIICADDDRGKEINTGRKAAIKASVTAKARIWHPVFPPDAPLHLSDFNDLACWMKGGV